ncbi:hypothetical protein D9M69_646680 [compost metagenome]
MITIVKAPVESTSLRCAGIATMTPKAKTIKPMTSHVSQGNNHILNSIRALDFSSFARMRNCENAITRYTSRAMAPELASRNANTCDGAKKFNAVVAIPITVLAITAPRGTPADDVRCRKPGASLRLLSE